MSAPPDPSGSPIAAPLISRRWVIALALLTCGIMLSGGLTVFALAPNGGVAAVPGAPHGGSAWISPLAVQSGQQLQTDPFNVIPGAPLSNLANASVLGPAPPNHDTWFTIGFPLQNESKLAEIISEQGTPGSPLYHHWLTSEQESAMFGANPAEIQNAVNYFTSLGFSLGTVGPISVSFHAPASVVANAFHTTLSTVSYGSPNAPNLTVAASTPLALPAPLAGGLTAIDGLSGPGKFHYTSFVDPAFAQMVQEMQAGQGTISGSAPSAPSTATASLAQAYNYTDQATMWFYLKHASHGILKTSRYQSEAAATFNKLYNADPLLAQGYNGNSTGKPITIAIVMEGGINPGDLQSYGTLVYNNPNQIVNRVSPDPVDGAYTWNGTLYYTDGGSGEMALDIEYSSTAAPGAHIVPVYSQSFAGNFLDDQFATIDTMRVTPNIVSNSWGGSEDGGNLYAPGLGNDLTMHYYFMLLDAKGASVLASSADGGGFDPVTGILSGSFPAADPYVLSVDGLRSVSQDNQGIVFPMQNLTYGTFKEFIPLLEGSGEGNGVSVTMFVTSSNLRNQSYWYEPVTNYSLYSGPPGGSGGFGFSYWYTQPWYEHAQGVPNVGRSLGSGVAAEGDFNMSIFFDGVPNFLYGGTSFACPTVAGMIADIEDYLVHNSAAFSPLKSGYLGNLNIPVFEMGNAWLNGNLSLDPYYDVNNGTSYWGNHGASLQYSWPPGQNFPTASNGASVYGDTVPGWDFPTGWGSINVYNFAQDMLQMANEEAFMTVNATSNTWAPSEWGSMTLNQTYTIDINATSSIAAANPTVSVEYFPQGGAEQILRFHGASLPQVLTPGIGLRFTLDTSAAPFAPSFSPGLIILTLGNSTNRNVGFGFGWVGPSIAPGPLTVTVQNPGGGSIVGGCASANVDWPLGSLFPGVQNSGLSCATYTLNGGDSRTPFATLYQNTFTVRVTNSLGQGVYNAMVTAQVPSIRDLAWVGSMAECQTTWYCRSSSLMPTIISETFTNLTGYALVETSNMAFPTPYFVNATYGPETGGTTYLVTPAPNIQPIGPDSGKYAVFNPVDLELWIYHQNPSNQTLQNWVPNYLNTSSLYTSLYGWQGETLRLHISNSTGAPLGGRKVWLGTYDTGREYKFQRYIGTAGMLGVTNSSPILGNDTWGYTDGSGDVSINIPDNMSASNFWGYLAPAPMGVASISVDTPGVANNTFQYIEKCAPLNFSNPSPLINCEFNNSYQRNYTSTPLWILPNPVHVVSMTTAHVDRDFFGSGANISLRVNVSLPTQNPIEDWYFLPNGYDGNPGQWSSGLEHVTGMNVYVDNQFVENVTPEEPPQIQGWAQFNNLTGNYTPGIHELTVRVTTSLGQIFTNTHRFIVGSIVNENLGIKNLYLPVPYLLNWSINIPASEVSNVTFNSSLQIVYVPPSGGCFFALACQVVNYSVKVHPHQVNFNQSINTTLLNKNGFYSGAGGLPPGQYNVIIWFSANHSGSIRQSYTPYLVFDPLSGQITGPTSGAQVPLGNVTLAYTYQGGYVTNATLEVWQENSNGTSQLVYTQLAFIPANGGESRSGSVTWTAVSTGTYTIDLVLGAPYGTYNATEKIFVQNLNPPVFINKTNGQLPLFNLNPVAVSTLLALVAGIVGILLGLWVAPVLRPTTAGPGAAAPAKAWEEGKTDSKSASAVKNECSICHERFETPDGLHQHQKVVHGIEE